jgi:hypothetical protein
MYYTAIWDRPCYKCRMTTCGGTCQESITMTDDRLMNLMREVDPQTKRIPPGVRIIVNAAIESECASLRAALLTCARQAEALKRECGMDPESDQAVRNAQYQAISTTAHIALGTVRGPASA